MTAVLSGLGRSRKERKRRELTQVQKAVIVAVGMVGAFVGTIVGLIVLTIIIGAAGGH
jgi:uncharacterized membrane protein